MITGLARCESHFTIPPLELYAHGKITNEQGIKSRLENSLLN